MSARPGSRRAAAARVRCARQPRPGPIALSVLALLTPLLGCALPKHLTSAERYERGLVIVLPGIEGHSPLTHSIALGLDEGHVEQAIEIFDWTVPVPGAYLFNLADLERNRLQGRKLADRIQRFRDEHPAKPVFVVGHSGGGGVATLAVAALPAGTRVDMLLLLAPALSPNYDLSAALRRTRYGIHNFYSPLDVGFLTVGTTVFGNIDREHGASAGALGFSPPATLSRSDQRQYDAKLRQTRWNIRLARTGATGGHLGWASSKFAREHLAPMIVRYARRSLERPEPAASQPAASQPG
ncbi:MAG: hypothetical protein CHACPFDD_01163 [Phycisphaerae bacterium]|nr:hypothetical protein [Phycisphaerae bacterium]